MFKLDRCISSCNTLINDLSNKLCVPNKTEDLNIHAFNMITGINEPKILTKHISCKFKCKFDKIKCNSNQKQFNDKCWYKWKKIRYVTKIWFGILLHVVVKMVKYLASIFDDDSMIRSNEIIEEWKTIPTNFNEKSNL